MGIKGINSLRRKVRGMERNLGSNVEDAVESAAGRTADEARIQLQNGNQIWTGDLLSRIRMRKRAVGDVSRFIVVADTPYAKFVEYGTGMRSDASDAAHTYPAPSEPPVRQIADWVATKPAFFGERSLGTAFAIAKTIAERGTHAHPFMRPAWFVTKPLLIEDAEKAVRDTVRRGR